MEDAVSVADTVETSPAGHRYYRRVMEIGGVRHSHGVLLDFCRDQEHARAICDFWESAKRASLGFGGGIIED
jgi:hypothetical protein